MHKFNYLIISFATIALQVNSKESVSLRHIEGGGIGYNQGYTTLDGFFAYDLNESAVPFLDLRAHVFNDGKLALNTGLGFRYLPKERIYGFHAFYDYRNTSHDHYNQITIGLETLGQFVDARISGYFPVGSKYSGFYDNRFGYFEQNQFYVCNQQEYAMTGFHAEAGFHLGEINWAKFYGAIGPYYFQRGSNHAWGGQGRISVDLTRYVSIEGSYSYDNLFHSKLQGQIGFNFAFGKSKLPKDEKKPFELKNRAFQKVIRDEIIVLDQQKKCHLAYNPLTDAPYKLIFVDNTSHSMGTFESPYPTLQEAEDQGSPYDVIYVYPGDGSPYLAGGATGILLKDYQKLLGSGIPQQLDTQYGRITIPQMSSNNPQIVSSNLVNSYCVQLANFNEVAGFNFLASANVNNLKGVGYGFSSTGLNVQNAAIHHNFFDGFTHAIDIFGGYGDIYIANNDVIYGGVRSSRLIRVLPYDSSTPTELKLANVHVNYNQVTYTGTSNLVRGIQVWNDNYIVMNSYVIGNTVLMNNGNSGILISQAVGKSQNFIKNNHVTMSGSGVAFFNQQFYSPDSLVPLDYVVSDNHFEGKEASFYFLNNGNYAIDCKIHDNMMSSSEDLVVQIQPSNPTGENFHLKLSVNNNVIQTSEANPINGIGFRIANGLGASLLNGPQVDFSIKNNTINGRLVISDYSSEGLLTGVIENNFIQPMASDQNALFIGAVSAGSIVSTNSKIDLKIANNTLSFDSGATNTTGITIRTVPNTINPQICVDLENNDITVDQSGIYIEALGEGAGFFVQATANKIQTSSSYGIEAYNQTEPDNHFCVSIENNTIDASSNESIVFTFDDNDGRTFDSHVSNNKSSLNVSQELVELQDPTNPVDECHCPI